MASSHRAAWRGLGAVLAGLLSMMIMAPAITALLRLVWSAARNPDPPTWYLAVDLTYALGATALGGLVCAYVARQRTAPLVLAGIVLVLGLATIVAGLDTSHPWWYQWGSAILGSGAVLLGARLRLRARAVSPSSVTPG